MVANPVQERKVGHASIFPPTLGDRGETFLHAEQAKSGQAELGSGAAKDAGPRVILSTYPGRQRRQSFACRGPWQAKQLDS
jgi:hypothetical protein